MWEGKQGGEFPNNKLDNNVSYISNRCAINRAMVGVCLEETHKACPNNSTRWTIVR